MSFLNQTLLQYQLLEPRSHVQDVKKAGLFAWGLWYDTEHDSNPELWKCAWGRMALDLQGAGSGSSVFLSQHRQPLRLQVIFTSWHEAALLS